MNKITECKIYTWDKREISCKNLQILQQSDFFMHNENSIIL